MAEEVILDTGPLVAYLDKRQEHHAWAKSRFEALSGFVVTCEAVITEACFLLADHKQALEKIAGYLRRGVIRPVFMLGAGHARVFELMRKYADIPMSFADACLVCMAEERPRSRVFTLDSDFGIYRLGSRRPVPCIAPS